ncbi:MAG: mechanosensitive ion channel family protein [Halobacteria archaeon]
MAMDPLPFLENVPYGVAVSRVIYFIISFTVIYLIGRVGVKPAVNSILKKKGMGKHVRKPINTLTTGVIVFAAISLAFGFSGLGNFLQALTTIAAAATLAVGFASKDIIANLVAGVFIYADQPFKTGDWIGWEGYEGTVQDISLRVTRVRTFDGEILTVPNSQLADNVTKNFVKEGRLRLRVQFGIGYGDDVERAGEIIYEEAIENSGLMNEPDPQIRFHEFGDSHIGLEARVWIDDPAKADFIKTRSDFRKSVKKRFDEEGIEIPFPQRTLSGEVDLETDGAKEIS